MAKPKKVRDAMLAGNTAALSEMGRRGAQARVRKRALQRDREAARDEDLDAEMFELMRLRNEHIISPDGEDVSELFAQ